MCGVLLSVMCVASNRHIYIYVCGVLLSVMCVASNIYIYICSVLLVSCCVLHLTEQYIYIYIYIWCVAECHVVYCI